MHRNLLLLRRRLQNLNDCMHVMGRKQRKLSIRQEQLDRRFDIMWDKLSKIGTDAGQLKRALARGVIIAKCTGVIGITFALISLKKIRS